SDTDLDDLDATAIAASWLTRLMQHSMSKRIVLLLDCCHAGAITRGMLARGEGRVGTAELAGRGRVILTASDALEYALEDGELVDDLVRDLEDDRSWKRSGAVLRLGELLRGRDADLAALAAGELQRIADHDDSRTVAAAARAQLGQPEPAAEPEAVPEAGEDE